MLFPLLIGISGRLATLVPTALTALFGIFVFVAFSKKAFLISILALVLTYLDKHKRGYHNKVVHVHRLDHEDHWQHKKHHHYHEDPFYYSKSHGYPSSPVESSYYPYKQPELGYYPSKNMDYPSKPIDSAYYPSKPIASVHYPTKPISSSHYPTKPGDSSYYPTKPGESSYYPTKPGESSYYPTKPGESSYYPTKPHEYPFVKSYGSIYKGYSPDSAYLGNQKFQKNQFLEPESPKRRESEGNSEETNKKVPADFQEFLEANIAQEQT